VTVGFSSDCTIVLPERPPGSLERVRIWQREGRFMLHNLSRGGRVSVAGRPVSSWVVLDDGDAIDIGGCTIRFQFASPPSNGSF
jgi:hypothetical protein